MNTENFTNIFKGLFGESITPTSSLFVPITTSNGTPAGISSMANLASVLGVYLPFYGNQGEIDNWDLNEQYISGIRFARTNCANKPAGAWYGIVLTFKVIGSNGLQLYFDWGGVKVYWRLAQDNWQWQSWNSFTIE